MGDVLDRRFPEGDRGGFEVQVHQVYQGVYWSYSRAKQKSPFFSDDRAMCRAKYVREGRQDIEVVYGLEKSVEGWDVVRWTIL